MGPLPTGVQTQHIKASHGADTNVMKFYVTSNSTTYGKHWDKFQPRQGRHSGTGYLANFRPGVYYTRKLDERDNPYMSHVCGANYMTVTQRDFRGYEGHTGREPLPFQVHQVGSGFIRQKPITNPTEAEVKGMFIDTRAASAPANILPRGKPRLHTLHSKDPVELENAGYGPGFMETETKVQFQGKQNPNPVDLSQKAISRLEDSGFTHNYNIEPITFHPASAHTNELPGWATIRPTGRTIMKTSFLPLDNPHGKEPFNSVSHGSERGSGFTRETAKPTLYCNRVMTDAYDHAENIPGLRLDRTRKVDPTEYLNMVHPNNHSSIIMDTYKGQQRPAPSEADRLDRTAVGNKELTGFVENNDRFIQTADNPRRFITHYMTKFTDTVPYGKDREGHCRGGIQRQKPDGYTKSTAVHAYGPDINSTTTLRRLEPYVARSLRARDQFYDDHTYDSKTHTSVVVS